MQVPFSELVENFAKPSVLLCSLDPKNQSINESHFTPAFLENLWIMQQQKSQESVSTNLMANHPANLENKNHKQKQQCLRLLRLKTLKPYFISNRMMMDFEHEAQTDISMLDIFQKFLQCNHQRVKYFFKKTGFGASIDTSPKNLNSDSADQHDIYFEVLIIKQSLSGAEGEKPFMLVQTNQITDIIKP